MLNISGLDDPMLVVYMAECDDIKIRCQVPFIIHCVLRPYGIRTKWFPEYAQLHHGNAGYESAEDIV